MFAHLSLWEYSRDPPQFKCVSDSTLPLQKRADMGRQLLGLILDRHIKEWLQPRDSELITATAAALLTPGAHGEQDRTSAEMGGRMHGVVCVRNSKGCLAFYLG